jgi:excinuclease ABC subunit A
MAQEFIKIGGAREHNLKNLTLDIPRNRLVVITGLSGSGKSSLAFDTIFAEGQRKYVESLSAYARQFLDQMQKPEVDFIEGLSPAIAIEQRTSGSNPRSTIATTTEIFDYLRLLFANVGQPHCPETGEPITHQTTTNIVDRILQLPIKSRVMLLAPVITSQKGEFRDVLERLAREGFVRARVDGQLVELSSNARVKLEAKEKHTIDVVVDRLVIDEKDPHPPGDSVETVLKWGEGRLLALSISGFCVADGLERNSALESFVAVLQPARVSTPDTEAFSFNSPFGACPVCHGLGQKLVFDEGLIVPDAGVSPKKEPFCPGAGGGKRMITYCKAFCGAWWGIIGSRSKRPMLVCLQI